MKIIIDIHHSESHLKKNNIRCRWSIYVLIHLLENVTVCRFREITFENAEELTEEGLPFLILFHAPDDTESIKNYKSIVEAQLLSEKRKKNL